MSKHTHNYAKALLLKDPIRQKQLPTKLTHSPSKIIMNIQKLNETRAIVINHAIEIALRKGWPYGFDEMMADGKQKLAELRHQDSYSLLSHEETNASSLIEEDFRNWIKVNDPTFRYRSHS